MKEVISIEDIRDIIPKNHTCFLVEKTAVEVDFTEWEEEHWDKPGTPAYHPRILLRAIIQAYIDNIKSGRELGKRVKTDLSYIYLCCSYKIDFRTLNRFYKNYPNVITATLLKTILSAKKEGMKRLGELNLESITDTSQGEDI